jgi:GMP synthase-like glutamine amidotransferase
MHHSDMVLDYTGFDLLFTADTDRQPSEEPGSLAADPRCQVQGMRLSDTRRYLYSVQFHPEMSGWGRRNDDGWGRRFMKAFFSLADSFWKHGQ